MRAMKIGPSQAFPGLVFRDPKQKDAVLRAFH
jgi:hypothetical protein